MKFVRIDIVWDESCIAVCRRAAFLAQSNSLLRKVDFEQPLMGPRTVEAETVARLQVVDDVEPVARLRTFLRVIKHPKWN